MNWFQLGFQLGLRGLLCLQLLLSHVSSEEPVITTLQAGGAPFFFCLRCAAVYKFWRVGLGGTLVTDWFVVAPTKYGAFDSLTQDCKGFAAWFSSLAEL